MTDWKALVRPPLRDLGAYVPGPSLDQLKAEHGLGAVIKLNWNEGLLGALPGVLEETAAALDEAWAYPEQAYLELRERIADWTGLTPAHVLPGHGIQSLVLTLVGGFLAPGDRVVVPELTYGLYARVAQAAGAVVRTVPSPGLELDLPALAAAAREADAKLVWVCDPNNPTGSWLGARQWSAFLDAVPPGCVVVADEAYAEYLDPAQRLRREPDVLAGRPLVILRTFSKVFGLAGLRLGYALVDPALGAYLHTLQEPFNVNRAALAAGTASLRRLELLEGRRRETVAAREELAALLGAGGLEVRPSAANFVLVRLGADDREVVARLLERGILVREGSDFGLPGWARITVGPAEVMRAVAPEVVAAAQAARASSRPAA